MSDTMCVGPMDSKVTNLFSAISNDGDFLIDTPKRMALYRYLKLLDQQACDKYEACKTHPREIIASPVEAYSILCEGLHNAPWLTTPLSMDDCCNRLDNFDNPADYFSLTIMVRDFYVSLSKELDINPDTPI